MSGGSLPSGAPGHRGAVPDDPQEVLAGLVDGVGRALPSGLAEAVLTVERRRGLADRLAGRPGTIEQVRLDGVDEAMTLRLDGQRLHAEAARVSGGVVIARRTLPIGAWLEAFAGQVAAVAADAAGDAVAAARALAAFGVRPSGVELRVDDGDIPGGLVALRAAVEGRITPDAAARVARIADLVRDALPRVSGGSEAEVTLRRTATTYLPDTIRAYLALPAEWATRHVLSDGRTAAAAFVAQLDALEGAATRMRDAAVERDASALLVNGRFLEDRFAASRLELD